MKRRQIEPEVDSSRAQQSLCKALLSLSSVAEMQAFLDDLCTPAEREAMRDRWSVVPHLVAGEPYWQIHATTAVSITTIGRVARCLDQGAGGYALAASRTKRKSPTANSRAEKPRAPIRRTPSTGKRPARTRSAS
ncbi:MAG: YerC/YecD family TrpR-related protein [Dokdonella sp.]